jgi:hypothetical protein
MGHTGILGASPDLQVGMFPCPAPTTPDTKAWVNLDLVLFTRSATGPSAMEDSPSSTT